MVISDSSSTAERAQDDQLDKKTYVRGDALKYWKWPPYSLKGQRS